MSNEERPKGGVHLESSFGMEPRTKTLREVAATPPFHLVIVGDFGGRAKDRMVDLSGEDIAGLLASHGATVELEVANRLGSEPPAFAVSLPLRSLRDLDPKTIGARLPEIVKAGESLRHTPATARVAPGPEPAEDNSLDALLSMVDVPAPPPEADRANAALSAFMAASPRLAAEPAKAGAPSPLLAAQLRDIAEHPAWLRAEAAWRGLRLILSARGRGAKPRIGLWDVAREDLADALESAAFADALDEDVDGGRWGAVVIMGAFGSTAIDFETLRRLALAGDALQTPVIVSLEAGFFGAAPDAVAAMDNPAALLAGPVHAAWRSLRGRPESQYLFAAWNDVALRAGDDDASPLWGDAGVIVATQIVASLARTGWPTEILGSESPVEGLDVVEVAGRGGRRIAIPLRAAMDAAVARDLAGDGLICLTCRADRDQAWLVRAASAHDYGKIWEEDRVAMEGFAGLSFRLVSALLESLCRDTVLALPRGTPDADAAAAITRALEDVLETSGAGASVTVAIQEPDADATRGFEVSVTLGEATMGGFGFSFDLAF